MTKAMELESLVFQLENRNGIRLVQIRFGSRAWGAFLASTTNRNFAPHLLTPNGAIWQVGGVPCFEEPVLEIDDIWGVQRDGEPLLLRARSASQDTQGWA